MKTAELTGAALDWAVAKCEGYLPADMKRGIGYFAPKDVGEAKYFTREYLESGNTGFAQSMFEPSTNWAQGGPIIEREKITVSYQTNAPLWVAMNGTGYIIPNIGGTTPLIAAMRCYVTSNLGDEVDIPKKLT